MFHSQSPQSILKEQDWPISVEYQMLAGEKEGVEKLTGYISLRGIGVVFDGNLIEDTV
jgi:hypothetical protein